jgi:uncharacterized alpha/beta hydrolase family protein
MKKHLLILAVLFITLICLGSIIFSKDFVVDKRENNLQRIVNESVEPMIPNPHLTDDD